MSTFCFQTTVANISKSKNNVAMPSKECSSDFYAPTNSTKHVYYCLLAFWSMLWYE